MRPAPGKGRVAIGPFSSIRKLMRAVRRGKLVPLEVTEKMLQRHSWYRRRRRA